MNIIRKYNIKASEILKDIHTYLTRLYGKTSETLSPASPFGQILTVLSNITELIFYYIEHSTVEQNILTANQDTSIYGLSRLTGHDVFRGTGAMGEISIKLKNTAVSDVIGDILVLDDPNAYVVDEQTGYQYTIMQNESKRINMKSADAFQIYNFEIVQGVKESQTVTSNGSSLASYNIAAIGLVDHNHIKVYVNDELWKPYQSLYDMLPDTKGVLVKTGISGGIDLFFGNGEFGKIPEAGARIKVDYILHEGSNGNIYDSTDLTFKIRGYATDNLGNEYSLQDLFDVYVSFAPKMGTNFEDTRLTKLLAPLTSKSFVLASPENFEYFLGKFGMFSYVDVYNTINSDEFIQDDNVIYIMALPDIKAKFGYGVNYFAIPINELVFNDDEKTALLKVIHQSGQQLMTSELQLVEPIMKFFKMEIFVKVYEGYSKNDLVSVINQRISEHLLSYKRRDRMPKSDIIALLENIEGIDSVNVRFLSAKEEEARRQGFYINDVELLVPKEIVSEDGRLVKFYDRQVTNEKITISENDVIPTKISNIDNFGDVVLNRNEIAIFRGGWVDYNGNEVLDEVNSTGNGCVSVYFDNIETPRHTSFINRNNNY